MSNLLITAVGAGTTPIHTKNRVTGSLADISCTVSGVPGPGTYFPDRTAGDFVHTDQRTGGYSDIDGHATDLQAVNLATDTRAYTAWGDSIFDRGGSFYGPRIAQDVDGAGTRAFAVDYTSFSSNYLTNALATTGLTSVAITQVLGGIGSNGLPQRIVLGWGTANAEEVLVTAYSAGVATLSGTTPTTNTHAANDPVAIGTEGGYGLIQTYFINKFGGASTGRNPRHIIVSWDQWLGRTQTEFNAGLGKGTVGSFIMFNGHIAGGAGDSSGHGVTIANGGNAGHKEILLLRQNYLERDDILYQGSVTGGTNAMQAITGDVGGASFSTGAPTLTFWSNPVATFHPDNQKGKWVRKVVEYISESSVNAADGVFRHLIDLNDGNGLQVVGVNTAASMGPEWFHSFQIHSIFNSPYQDQTLYTKNWVIYEPHDTRVVPPLVMYGAPTFVSHVTGQVTLGISVPSSGVDQVQFWHCAGNPSGPFTALNSPIAITSGDKTAGTKQVTLTLTSGQHYNIGYSFGLAGKFNLPDGAYSETIP